MDYGPQDGGHPFLRARQEADVTLGSNRVDLPSDGLRLLLPIRHVARICMIRDGDLPVPHGNDQ